MSGQQSHPDQTDSPRVAHLWRGPTPTPRPGDRALCGYVFGQFTWEGPDWVRCPICEEWAA